MSTNVNNSEDLVNLCSFSPPHFKTLNCEAGRQMSLSEFQFWVSCSFKSLCKQWFPLLGISYSVSGLYCGEVPALLTHMLFKLSSLFSLERDFHPTYFNIIFRLKFDFFILFLILYISSLK